MKDELYDIAFTLERFSDCHDYSDKLKLQELVDRLRKVAAKVGNEKPSIDVHGTIKPSVYGIGENT